MHLLILGGTSFVGRAIAVEAISRSHTVTILNRGTKPPPAGVQNLIGDRLADDGLDVLDGMTFDAVVDTWSGAATQAIQAMERLKGRCHHYTFISSVSVYNTEQTPANGAMFNEDTAVLDVAIQGASKSVYNYHKRTVEIATEQILQHIPRVIARCGVIIGPHEEEYIERGRLPWWLHRLEKGGRVVAPEPRDLELQLIDARDLAAFVLNCAENKSGGTFNLTGPTGTVTMEKLLDVACRTTGNRSELVWVSPERIMDAGVVPFMDLPLWVVPNSKMYRSFYSLDTRKAQKSGLVCRPIEETVLDTWQWMQGPSGPVLAPEGAPVGGLKLEKESILLGQ